MDFPRGAWHLVDITSQSVNGMACYSLTGTPQVPGNFMIPEFNVRCDSKKCKLRSLRQVLNQSQFPRPWAVGRSRVTVVTLNLKGWSNKPFDLFEIIIQESFDLWVFPWEGFVFVSLRFSSSPAFLSHPSSSGGGDYDSPVQLRSCHVVVCGHLNALRHTAAHQAVRP